ncbi:hypothetical protein AB7M17_005849 [Bradyrhizobium sp. USDA 377]
MAGPQDEGGVRGSNSTGPMLLSLILKRPLEAVVSKGEALALAVTKKPSAIALPRRSGGDIRSAP